MRQSLTDPGIDGQTSRRDPSPGTPDEALQPRQLQCPTCGCRHARRTALLCRAVERWEEYQCAGCGTQYRLRYSLIGREVLP